MALLPFLDDDSLSHQKQRMGRKPGACTPHRGSPTLAEHSIEHTSSMTTLPFMDDDSLSHEKLRKAKKPGQFPDAPEFSRFLSHVLALRSCRHRSSCLYPTRMDWMSQNDLHPPSRPWTTANNDMMATTTTLRLNIPARSGNYGTHNSTTGLHLRPARGYDTHTLLSCAQRAWTLGRVIGIARGIQRATFPSPPFPADRFQDLRSRALRCRSAKVIDPSRYGFLVSTL